MKRILLLIIILIPLHAYAEPSKSVDYLMRDSMSMFDWGLYKLGKSLEEEEFVGLDLTSKAISWVGYEWDKNLIEMKVTIYPSNSSIQKSSLKGICRSAQTSVKTRYGYGASEIVQSQIGINSFFKHKGFVKKDSPETLKDDLDTMTKITIKVYAFHPIKPRIYKQSTCTSRLMEDDIYFVDNEKKDKP